MRTRPSPALPSIASRRRRRRGGALLPVLLLPLVLALAAPPSADAQLLDRLKDRAERALADRIADMVQCAFDDLECIRGAEDDGEEVALTDREGNVLTDEEGEPVSDPEEARAMMGVEQVAGAAVGTIEIDTPSGTRTFTVVEGPPTEGYSTGYRRTPIGERWALSFSVTGEEDGTGASLLIQTGVYQESMEQVCDPFSNNVELHGTDDGGRLRPGGTASENCGNSVDIDVTEASWDEAAGTLHVAGDFSGPIAGSSADVESGDALMVTEGRFEATLHSFESLMGG